MLKQVQHDVRPYTLVFQTFFVLTFFVLTFFVLTFFVLTLSLITQCSKLNAQSSLLKTVWKTGSP